MIVGMDFGTTNSGMAVANGRSVNVLPLDPSNRNPRIVRTALYITNDHSVHIGRAAVDHYFEHNIGRAAKMRRVWIGELEIFGADMYYVTDAYVYVDVLSPGRLFLSIKTGLRSEDYPGTVIGQHYYSLENLIATYLTVTKVRAEQLLDQPLTQVVLGRPVRFSFEPEKDKLAQARLMRAAFQAGYDTVYFQQEPIAAATSYEATLDHPQNVLVFDFGGGTLDVTVMRLGEASGQRVLATGGIPIAGDVFDQRLVRQKLARHFGEGSPYGPRHKKLTVPGWIYDSFSNWQTILELQSREKRQSLQEMAQTARRRYQLEALISLVSNNYGLTMFDRVEQAKRQLSEKRGAEILLEGPGFNVRDFVTRREFENIIRQEIVAIDQHLDEVVGQSGLAAEQIDAVIRTGGSAQIPVFVEMLARKFGEEKVQSIDTFSSVTAGLGIWAQQIEQGTAVLPAFTPADDLAQKAKPHQSNVVPISLEMVQRRIVAKETGLADAVDAIQAMIVLDEAGVATAVPLDIEALIPEQDASLARLNLPTSVTLIRTGGLDTRLLLLSSHYRFVLTTARQLIEQQQLDLTLGDLVKLERQETIVNLANWTHLIQHPKLLLLTSAGIARPYPMEIMRENIEQPTPLKFDHPLEGIAVTVAGAAPDDTAVLISQSGRGVRYPVGDLRTSGTQAFNCGQTDRIVAGLLTEPERPLTLITADGYGRYLLPEMVPVPPKPNSKGKSLIARRSPVVTATTAQAGWLITNQRLAWVSFGLLAENGRLSLEDSTRSEPLVKLNPDEQVQGFLAG